MDFEYIHYYYENLSKEKQEAFDSLFSTFKSAGYSKEDSVTIAKCYIDGFDSNECNKKMKLYGNGFFKWQDATNDIYHKYVVPRVKMWWEEEEEIEPREIQHKSADQKQYYAIRRAKERIFDIVMCNDWKYFCTLTIDPKENDSSDVAFVRKKLKKWLNNMQNRRGLQYLLVPELHKIGGKIHAHLLINDCDLKLEDSGTVAVPSYKKPIKIETADRFGIPQDQRKTVYNITDWKYGFTTAIRTYGDNYLRTAIYIMKYITKDSDMIFGKYFWSSKGIHREPMTVLGRSDLRWWDIYYNKESVYIPGTETKILYGTNIGYTLGKNDFDEQVKSLEKEAEAKTEYEYFSTIYGLQEELHLEEIEALDDSWL